MSRERNLIAATLTAAVGGALTYAAIKNREGLVIAAAKQVIRYDERIAYEQGFNNVMQRIRGHRVYMDQILAEILCQPDAPWEKVNPVPFFNFNRHYFLVHGRSSSIGPEVIIARAFYPPHERSRFMFGASKEAQIDYWIAGRNLDLENLRENIKD